VAPVVQRAMVLFPLAFLFMLAGMHPLAIVCYVLLTAPFRLAGESRKAVGTVLWAGVLALVMMNSFLLALAYAAGAGIGIVIAMAIERRWSYGWQLTLAAGAGFVELGGVMLAVWSTLRHETTIFMNARIAELEAQENVNTQWIDLFQWWDVNYAYLGPGSAFGSVLVLAAFALCTLERWGRDPELRARRKPTGFQRMRVPDWVVWIVIFVALLWFADYRSHHPAVRAVAWNTAVGLAFVYGLNGLSILLYALSVFKASVFVAFMVFSGLFLFGLTPMLGMFGLFDTWYDFRWRLRRIAMLRRVSYRPDDQDS